MYLVSTRQGGFVPEGHPEQLQGLGAQFALAF